MGDGGWGMGDGGWGMGDDLSNSFSLLLRDWCGLRHGGWCGDGVGVVWG